MLRLQRIGKKKSPTYRLIVSEKTKDTQAGSLENWGIYNPVATPKVIEFKKDRINYWLSVGAQPSATVNNLLVNEGIVKGEKKKSVFFCIPEIRDATYTKTLLQKGISEYTFVLTSKLTKKEISIAERIKKIYNFRGKPEAVKKSLELLEKYSILKKEEERKKKFESE